MHFWDQQFSPSEFKYGVQPNRFLQSQAYRLAPHSQVLLPGDGEGRNSVWLAQQGHQVTAMDQSIVGLQKARHLAALNQVPIQVIHADLADWVAPVACFDALVLTYVHLPAALRPLAHQHLFEALRPGGWFIFEAFHPRQLAYQSGGPKALEMLCTVGMIRTDLAAAKHLAFQETMAWEGEDVLAEGPGHQGPAYLTRFVAQRIGGRTMRTVSAPPPV